MYKCPAGIGNKVITRVCTPTLEMWGRDSITEIDETMGVFYVTRDAMYDGNVTFTC